MYVKIVNLLWGILLVSFCAVFAQKNVQPDTIPAQNLQEIVVKGSLPIDRFSTTRKVAMDSLWVNLLPQTSLTELLGRQSPVFMREYGVGGLASPSIRGLSGSQTAILWNGINIQSPMSGASDFSLIPVVVADKVAIQYGGSSAHQGNSVMGGAVLLDNVPQFSSGVSASSRFFVGSFGRWGQQYNATFGSAKFYTSTKFFQQEAQNNYPYKNTNEPNQPIVYQVNNQTKQKGVIQEFSWQMDSTQTVNARVWYQENDRHLPPTMGITFSRKQQQDQVLRTMLDWNKRYRNIRFLAKGAYINEFLGYQDSDTKVNSLNRAHIYIADVSTQLTVRNQLVGLGVQGTFNRSQTTNYGGVAPYQDRVALYANYSFLGLTNRLEGVLNIRQEMVNGKFIPLVFSAKATYSILKSLSVAIGASRNYRVPSLNDLHWSPGGNLNLRPEDAWMQDITLKYVARKEGKWLEAELAAFNTVINHAIVWLPGNTGIWSPVNVNQTWGRGTEFSTRAGFGVGRVKFSFQVQYHYTKSTIQSSANKEEANKQLIFTPLHKGMGGLTVEWKGVTFNYSQTFTGLRYSTSDNTQWTDGYTLGSVMLAYQLTYKHFNGNVYAQINNLWNTDYQILPQYASPVVNYQVGITLSALSLFTKPSKSNTL